MHFAKLATSARLKRALNFMADGKEHSTMEISRGANICAVNSVMDELRENGIPISPARLSRVGEDGTRVYVYKWTGDQLRLAI